MRALFSTRYFQQLLREGKLGNEKIYLFSILIYLFEFPCLILIFFQSHASQLFEKYSLQPLQLYVLIIGFLVILLLFSQFFLWYFTSLFNYQEQRYLYMTSKALFRLYHSLLLVSIIPAIWYARLSEIIFFVYLPLLIILFLTFFVRFLRNLNGVSRIHFFIYFCSLEILPYFLLIKMLIINM